MNAIVASIENTRSAFTLLKQVIDRLQNSRTEGTNSANKAEQAMQSLFITVGSQHQRQHQRQQHRGGSRANG